MNADLTRRVAFTLGALLVYRLGLHIPLPGIDIAVWEQLLRPRGSLAEFSTNAAAWVGIFSLGIAPYLTAALAIQLMKFVSPTLRWLNGEAEKGRIILDQYTRYLAVLLAAVHSYGLAIALEAVPQAVSNPGFFFRMSTVITLTGGVVFLIWLSDQITARGIGNGIVLMLFLGVVMDATASIAGAFEAVGKGYLSVQYVTVLAALSVAAVGFIAFVEMARLRIPIQFPRRQIGWRVFEDVSTHLPLKLNTSGVIPPIFASSLLLLPTTVANFNSGQMPDWVNAVVAQLSHGRPLFLLFYVALIVFFAFFYTAIVFNPDAAAELLKRQGARILGVESGEAIAAHLDFVGARLTALGAIYLLAVVLIPDILFAYTQLPFYFSGISAMVVVCAVLDISARVREAHAFAGA